MRVQLRSLGSRQTNRGEEGEKGEGEGGGGGGGGGGRGKKKNTPEHSWPLVAACGSTPSEGKDCDRDTVEEEEGPPLCVNSLGGFCLLHHLFLLKGGFDLCIHLNSKEGPKKKKIKKKIIPRGWWSSFIHKCSSWDFKILNYRESRHHFVMLSKLIVFRLPRYFRCLMSDCERCLSQRFFLFFFLFSLPSAVW